MQRSAYASKPLLVRSGRKIVLGERMVITVENEPDRVDQGAVEVEENGLELDMTEKLPCPSRFSQVRRAPDR